MAEIAHSFTEVTTPQTTTSTTYVDITGASIASGNFVAGKKYLLLLMAQMSGASVTVPYGVKALHGTTDFTESIAENEPHETSSRHDWAFMTVWTAVAGEGIKLQFRTVAAGTARADQITLSAINLSDDLTENTDWFYNENLTATAASTTFSTSNNASVTFTPAAGNDWLVLASSKAETGEVTNNHESRINSSGTFTETVPLVSQEDEFVGGFDQFLLSRVFTALGAVSQTFTQQFRKNAGTCTIACERLRSAIFALNLNKFKNHSQVWTAGPTDLTSLVDFANNIATITMTPDVAGDVWAGYTWTFDPDPDLVADFCRSRLQVDNADQPPTQTADVYPQGSGRDSTDQAQINMQSIVNLTQASHTWDVDADGEVTTDNASYVSLWVVTMELAAGAAAEAVIHQAVYRGIEER